MEAKVDEMNEDYSLSAVIAQAIQGLNRVDLYLKNAAMHNDPNTVRWLEETKRAYQQILGAAQEFTLRRENETALPVNGNRP